MSIKEIYEYIKTFLFSNVNKQFLVFLFFLVLSGIFWLTMTLNETYEHEIKIPVRVTGIPKNVVLTSAATDTLRASIRDKGWVIMSYLYGQRTKVVSVPFRIYDRGNGGGSVTSADLKRIIEQSLEVSSKVITVKPERLEFFYNNGQRKRVPVRWAGRIIPDQLYFISQVTYSPDSVDVYTSKEKLDSIRAIYTEPLNYVNFRDTLTLECKLAHPADVKVVPERIQIRFFTDVLSEETMSNIPIQCINVPQGKVLRLFTKAKVHFVAGVSKIKTLRPEDFVVVADFNEIKQGEKEKCTLSLRQVPHGISRARLEQKEIDYVIENE